jgi:hypothetical protein
VFGVDLVKLIDARIEAARQRWTATGTLVERQSQSRATVTFDGSSVPVPVKVSGHVPTRADSRVMLTRFGSDWVVTGAFTGTAELVAVASAKTDSSNIGPGEGLIIAVTGFTFEAQTVYRVNVGGQIQPSTANHTLWRVRNSTTVFTTDWGTLGHTYTPETRAYIFGAEKYIARTASTPLTGQTIGITGQNSTGTIRHVGTATAPRYLEIYKCSGGPADYPHALTI